LSKVACETPSFCASGQVDCSHCWNAVSAKAGDPNAIIAIRIRANRMFVMPSLVPGIPAFES
jgi:hypothetical protein